MTCRLLESSFEKGIGPYSIDAGPDLEADGVAHDKAGELAAAL
jgi:hypothetical protein